MIALLIALADPPRDWGATLRSDAQAFHDTVAANHPGPVNRLDPGFAKRSDAELRLALRRAATAHSYPGYLFAMRAYVAGFDDGHVAFTTLDGAPPLPAKWPGFLTGYDGAGRQVVATRADDAPVPLGTELVGCDGVPAEALAARNVGTFAGRWMLAAQRITRGGRLFVDLGNPYIVRPARCTFRVDGADRTVTLVWRDLADADYPTRMAETARRADPPIAARTLADGTRWYALSGFKGDPGGADARALVPLIAGMRADRAAVVAAPRVVLDLRGNGGGSSEWSRRIATILWGQAAVDAVKIDADAVDWRASPANAKTMADYRDAVAAASDVSDEAKSWAARGAAGLAGALAKGQPLWRAADDPAAAKAAPAAPVSQPKARIVVLTDWGCGSACLDAVDLWLALGAIHVGQETTADTLYMDLRQDVLPSGMARAGIPMKVYRGRPRGSNVAVVPRFRYTGDLRDTGALERWIAGPPG